MCPEPGHPTSDMLSHRAFACSSHSAFACSDSCRRASRYTSATGEMRYRPASRKVKHFQGGPRENSRVWRPGGPMRSHQSWRRGARGQRLLHRRASLAQCLHVGPGRGRNTRYFGRVPGAIRMQLCICARAVSNQLICLLHQHIEVPQPNGDFVRENTVTKITLTRAYPIAPDQQRKQSFKVSS